MKKELEKLSKIKSLNTSIRLEIRRICSIEPGNTECRKYAMKSPCYINFIFGCKRYYKFISFNLKFTQGTVNIDRDYRY